MTRKALMALVPLLGFLAVCSDVAAPPASGSVVLEGVARDAEGVPRAGWDVAGVVYPTPCTPMTDRSDNTARTKVRSDGSFTLDLSLPRGVESCVNVLVSLQTNVTQQGGGLVSERVGYLHSVWQCAPSAGCERASNVITIVRPGA